jgi:hypothetical protein
MRFTLHFSTRDAFVAISILCLAIALGAHIHARVDRISEVLPPSRLPQGLVEGLLSGVGLLLLAFFVRCTWERRHDWLALALLPMGISCLWFACIDYAVTTQWCSQCGQHTHRGDFRVALHPVVRHFATTHHNFMEETGEALGVPCRHRYSSELRCCMQGLLIPRNCVSGICCLTDERSTAPLLAITREMAAEDPTLPTAFHQKAFVEHDSAYLQAFYAEVRRRRDAE